MAPPLDLTPKRIEELDGLADYYLGLPTSTAALSRPTGEHNYLQSLMSPTERKAIRPMAMALVLVGGNTWATQKLISQFLASSATEMTFQ